MSWFERFLPSKVRTKASERRGSVPEGLWSQCTACQAILYREELSRHLNVCPKCDHHMYLPARQRLLAFLDEDVEEIAADLMPVDWLKFKDSKRYKDRLSAAQKKTGENDALVAFKGALKGRPVMACAFEYAFIGGSMGAVVGEKFVKAAHEALAQGCPLVCFSASGGARMQEALTSLMQMAKTAAVLGRMKKAGLPFISVLLDPTMGGVSASFAMLGDVIIAEPKALIGFAGPRVIEQTIKEKLPEGFQRSEFLIEHGAIDQIIPRHELRDRIANLLSLLHRAA